MKKPRSLMPSVAGAALVAAMAAAPALAASPDAWKQHDKAVVKVCTDASQLKRTRRWASLRCSATTSATPRCCCRAATRKNT